MLLKNSIGGNAKTCIILCVTPGFKDFNTTMKTINFGCEAKKVVSVVQKNVKKANEEDMKIMLDRMNHKISKLSNLSLKDNVVNVNPKIKEIEKDKDKLISMSQ